VRMSYDEGKTWPVSRTIHPGATAYSSLAVLKNNSIACLYERGATNSYEKITFAQFTLDWLTDGADSPKSTRTPNISRR
ncbi:MAG: exo-alpha-sialidase, partial [Limisphaerales bacterium]